MPLKSDPNATACLNTSCGVTFVDKNLLLKQFSDQKKKKMSISLKVREIEASKHEFAQFAKLSLFFLEKNNKKRNIYTSIKCELYLIDGLKANILIGNNILTSESFVLNVGLGHALVGSCRVTITVRVKQRGQFLRKRLLAERDKVVALCSETIIPLLPMPLPDDRDFLFHPTA